MLSDLTCVLSALLVAPRTALWSGGAPSIFLIGRSRIATTASCNHGTADERQDRAQRSTLVTKWVGPHSCVELRNAPVDHRLPRDNQRWRHPPRRRWCRTRVQ